MTGDLQNFKDTSTDVEKEILTKQPKTDAYHATVDLLSGDDAAYSILDTYKDDIVDILKKISNDPLISTKDKINLLSNTWKINYRQKPPTIEEFLTPEWLGETAESLYPHVRKILIEFWSPDSKYRHLILASAIRCGKAQPYSSPVAIGKKIKYDIELENNRILSFYPEEKIYVIINHEEFFIPIEIFVKLDINKDDIENNIDFPEQLNYLIMRIYDVKHFKELEPAFKITSYNELIDFFNTIPDFFYDEHEIYTEKHHIIPRSENGKDEESNIIRLPYYFHIFAHYLRGIEFEKVGDLKNAHKNFKAVLRSLGTGHIPHELSDFMKELDFVIDALSRHNLLEEKRKPISKNGKCIRVFENEIDEYLKDGWEKKIIRASITGFKHVTKGTKTLTVPPEKVDEYLADGWRLGQYVTEKAKAANSKKATYATKDTVWINKDGIRKCVKKDLVESYLKDGWNIGSACKTVKGQKWKWKDENLGRTWYTNGQETVFTKECPEGFWKVKTFTFTNGKINVKSETCPEGFWRGSCLKGKPKQLTEQQRKNLSACHKGKASKIKGKIGITNGVINTYIEKDAPMPEGFRKGHSYKGQIKRSFETRKKLSESLKGKSSCIKGRRTVTNGIITKYIKKDDPIPEGFWKGTAWKGQKRNLSVEQRKQISERLSNANKDRITITNGIINKRILKTDSIPEGFWKGKSKT